MQRRSFLAGILAGAAAPAIVRASSLMKIWVPPQELIRGDCRIVADSSLLFTTAGVNSVTKEQRDALIDMILKAGKLLDEQNVPTRDLRIWTPEGIIRLP